jgi:hypothetical protein
MIAAKWSEPPQKLLDVSELARLGWRAKTPLRERSATSTFFRCDIRLDASHINPDTSTVDTNIFIATM